MSSSYDWDRSGPVDPELVLWEQALARYGHSLKPYRHRQRAWMPLAIVASVILLLAAGGVWWDLNLRATKVTATRGQVSINGQSAGGGARIRRGDKLTTGPRSRATVRFGKLGFLELFENSSLVLVAAAGNKTRVHLERGRLQAAIYGEPYAFTVETPVALADDMGCGYEISTDTAGHGFLRVTEGWVRLRARGVESLVIEGTEAALLTPSGPGVPVMKGASKDLRSLAGQATAGTAISDAALDAALAQSRPSDAITLLNLLWRVPGHRAVRIFARLAELHPPPPEVSWGRFQKQDWTAVADWWPYLGFKKSIKLPPVFYQN